jgi:argininosuccinate lyase
MLVMIGDAVPRLGVNAAACTAAVGGDLLATDEVYRRVRDGVPFRTAYRQVAAEIKNGSEMPSLDPDDILSTRTHLGGAGAPALDTLEEIATDAARTVNERYSAFVDAITELCGGAQR